LKLHKKGLLKTSENGKPSVKRKIRGQDRFMIKREGFEFNFRAIGIFLKTLEKAGVAI
jgi:hypothetical protein